MKELLRDNEGFFLRNYNYHFEEIDRIQMRELNITAEEVISVFENPNSYFETFDGFKYLIGFSNRRKFIHIAYIELETNDIKIKQVDLPYEQDLWTFYFNGRSKKK